MIPGVAVLGSQCCFFVHVAQQANATAHTRVEEYSDYGDVLYLPTSPTYVYEKLNV